MALKLTMACERYDRNLALLTGEVSPEGIELEIISEPGTIRRQQRARAGEFDVVEFYTGLYLADIPYKTLGLTAIPIFVKKMFRHSYIYINKEAGITAPSDLNGRRIGIENWMMSAGLFGRGLLSDEFGVDLHSITWVAERRESIGGWQAPPWLKLEIEPPGEPHRMEHLLAEGHVDAAITSGSWAPFGHSSIDFLFPDYAERERDYFKRTNVFPIMHTLLIRDRILEKHPWVARSMFDAWQLAKQHCYEWLEWQRIHQTGMWYRALWEEERSAAGSDIYPWGVAKNKETLEKMLDYAFDQGLTPERLAIEALFHPSTLDT